MSATVNPVNLVNTRAEQYEYYERTRRPYPAYLMAEARRLHEGGWTPGEIRRLFARRGEPRVPSSTTIRMWVDDSYRQRQLACHRQAHIRRARDVRSFKLAAKSPEYQAAFVQRLRGEGLPVAGIVRVCRVVFGGKWTRGRVERLLEVES